MKVRRLKTLKVDAAPAPLADLAGQLAGEPLAIVRDGRPIAVLVPVEGMDLESLSLSTNEDFLALIERARSRRMTEGTLSEDDLRRELGLPSNGPE